MSLDRRFIMFPPFFILFCFLVFLKKYPLYEKISPYTFNLFVTHPSYLVLPLE